MYSACFKTIGFAKHQITADERNATSFSTDLSILEAEFEAGMTLQTFKIGLVTNSTTKKLRMTGLSALLSSTGNQQLRLASHGNLTSVDTRESTASQANNSFSSIVVVSNA